MRAIYISLLLLCVGLCGCVTSVVRNQTTSGADFDETKIGQIQKGKTTADQIVSLFGEPRSEDIVSPNQILWRYRYQSTTFVDTYDQINGAAVKQISGYEKKLEILMQDDVVVNFSYVNAPINDVKAIPSE
ncbi:MAG TPA: hypothetical protein VME24_03795 [Alphaproteobacteria bacterium]|nr:hypothetical protein [Alphaproteobacteria bacterium]